MKMREHVLKKVFSIKYIFFIRIKNFNIKIAIKFISMVSVCFISSSYLTTILSSYLLPSVKDMRINWSKITISSPVSTKETLSFSEIEKNLLFRNIFNKLGEIPFEEEATKNFANIPCTYNEKLPVQILGILYTGKNETNLISIKDPELEGSDIYKEGQQLINREQYQIYKISTPTNVEIRSGKKKLCYSLSSQLDSTAVSKDNSKLEERAVEQLYSLESSFVDEQIGENFTKILKSARLLPKTSEQGRVSGFSIVDIQPDSLFDKIGMQNNDVIVRMNDLDMTDASYGFKIYDFFKNQSEITIQIERAGVLITKKVTIR